MAAEGELAVDEGAAQAVFGVVVGWLDAVGVGEGPERRPVFEQVVGEEAVVLGLGALADGLLEQCTYSSRMVNVTVSLPDELASEAIRAYVGEAPNGGQRRLGFVALGDGPPGFSAREAEQRLEDEGFEPSRSW